ncbi:MAG: zinc metalloprotease HtpX [Kiloniellales bacterium]
MTQRHRLQKLRNLAHSIILILGMAMLAAACAWTVWGAGGLIWAFAGVALALLISPSIPPGLVLSLYRARPLGRAEFPEGNALLRELAERADLPAVPRLYYVPSSLLNAFAVGNARSAAVAVTDGMLRRLSQPELAGVLAHEVSHIANNDLWIMSVADAMSRVTGLLSYFGLFLLAVNLPLIMVGAVTAPWLLVALLILAPTLMSLLQLALSRAREFDADLEAARLTGDPSGLASALAKLERYQGRFWEEIVFPGRRIPDPSPLRTHPPTDERIRRLIALEEAARPKPTPRPAEPIVVPIRLNVVHRPPRWRLPGLWY